MIVPLPKDKLSDYEAQVLRAITDRFGDYGVETWTGFGVNYITGWQAERQCNYAFIILQALITERQLFDAFLKFDEGIAEHRARLARRLIGATPPQTLPELISTVYGFDWLLGFAVPDGADVCTPGVPEQWADFGFDLPALLIQTDGSARWLENEESD